MGCAPQGQKARTAPLSLSRSGPTQAHCRVPAYSLFKEPAGKQGVTGFPVRRESFNVPVAGRGAGPTVSPSQQGQRPES